jgi:hypothetical protein
VERLFALVDVLETLQCARLGGDHVDFHSGGFERLLRFQQLRLFEAVGGEDGNALL